MKTKVEDLEKGDIIAFSFQYNSDHEEEIEVSRIASRVNGGFLVHFLYGYEGKSEVVKPEDVIAVGDLYNGDKKIKGWTGNFILINKNHRLVDSYIKDDEKDEDEK